MALQILRKLLSIMPDSRTEQQIKNLSLQIGFTQLELGDHNNFLDDTPYDFFSSYIENPLDLVKEVT